MNVRFEAGEPRSRSLSGPMVFSQDWWAALLDGSEDLTGPCLIKGSVPATMLTEAELVEILRAIPRETSLLDPTVRIYVEGGERPRELIALFREPVREGESFAALRERMFGDARFGIIINQVGGLLPGLCERLAPLYRGITERLGVPWLDMNPTIFVGNYGYTPFGAHFDGAGKSVIHFHLGPAAKRMSLWDADVFVRETGSRLHYSDPERLLPFGEHHMLEAGDTFFLPEGPFHVGYTEELSLALTVVLKGISTDEWVSRAVAEQQRDAYRPELLSGYDAEVDVLMRAGLVRPEVVERRFGDWLADAMHDLRLSMISNCGISTPIRAGSRNSGQLHGRRIERTPGFPILHRRLGDDAVRVFFRRNRRDFGQAAPVVALLERLNEGEVVEFGSAQVGELVDALLAHDAVRVVE